MESAANGAVDGAANGAADPAARLRISILGELRASHDGSPLDLGGRRQRAVLALLLLARGDVVPAEQLAEAVWGGRPPDDAVSAVQSYISHLRRRLQPGTPARARSSVIVREGPGYAVRQPADVVDAWRFEALLSRAGEPTRPEQGVSLLREALGLWKGPALVDYADEPWAVPEIARLTELRTVARERLLATRLETDAPSLLVPELEALVAEEPLREERWRLLVLALYRAQRQADALAALRRARQRLAEELGVDPGPALRSLEAEVLAQSPELVVPAQRGRADWVEPGQAPAVDSAPAPGSEPGSAPVSEPVSEPVGVPAPVPRRDEPALVERERELAVITDVLDELSQGRHGLVLVEGPPGIGKTRLLGEARRLAAGQSLTVLSARGSRLESAFAFGVVRQLFEPRLADPARREALIGGTASGARGVFDFGGPGGTGGTEGRDGGQGERADGFAVLHGLFRMAVNLTSEGPLVLVVDDAQWCDGASLRFLSYLARRLEALPLLLLVAVRSSEEPPADDLLSELAFEPAAVVLRPDALSVAATGELVQCRLQEPPSGRFVEACHRTTRGNPLLLNQLLRGLAADGVRPDAAHADRVVAVGSRAITSLVQLRLRRLPQDVAEVARSTAVLGDGAPLPVVAALAGLAEHRAAEALTILARAEIMTDRQPLAYLHPLVRDAVYESLPAVDRGLRHERAAAALRAHGAGDEHVAAHLLLAPPRRNEDVVELLRRASRSAADSGAAESAATYLRRALAESPTGPSRDDVLLRLGLLEATLDGPAAVEHLTEAYRVHEDAAVRAEIAIAAASTHVFASPPGVATTFARQAAAELPEELGDQRQALIALQRISGFMHAVDLGWRTPAPEPDGDGDGARMLAATIALEALLDGENRPRAVRLARFALGDDRLLEVDDGLFWVNAAAVRTLSDDDIGDFWTRARSRAHARGSLFATLSSSLWEGFWRWRRGELHEAFARLREALEQDRMWRGAGVGEPFARGFQIGCLLDRGDIRAARRVADEAGCPLFGEGGRVFQQAVARLLVAEGRNAEALAVLEAVPEGIPNANPAWNPWRSITAAALHGLGRTSEAITVAEEEVSLLRRWGAPSYLGRGLYLLGRLRGQEGIDDLRESVDLLASSPAAVDLARARCALASLPQVPDAEAIELLLDANRSATESGALGTRDLACAELRRRGHRVDSAEDRPWPLSSTERQIRDLAAGGLEVREIARRLFVTPGMVQAVLEKLGPDGRWDPAQVSLKSAGS